jgi:hypothetical protein
MQFTSEKPLFGSQTVQPFGSPAFGTQATSASLFGGGGSSQPGMFGTHTASTSLFGENNSSQPPQASRFSFGTQPQSTSIFGSPQQQQPQLQPSFNPPSQYPSFGTTQTNAFAFPSQQQSYGMTSAYNQSSDLFGGPPVVAKPRVSSCGILFLIFIADPQEFCQHQRCFSAS